MSTYIVPSSSTKVVRLNILKRPVKKSITLLSGICSLIINSKLVPVVNAPVLCVVDTVPTIGLVYSVYHSISEKVIGLE